MARSVPHSDQEAPTVAEAVVQHWISRYGVLFNFIPIREEISSLRTNKTGIRKFLLSASVPQRRSRDYRDIHHPRCFLAEIFVSLCDLLFGRPPIHLSSPEEHVQNLQARFEDVHNFGSRTDQPEDGEDEDSVMTQKPQDINSRKVTRCGSTT
ncbi:hypothetical protein TNCV_1702081 [Trichonephila clavipes]|nr:hypothetical protein TNCV_1702081 [Trichonephila clavipes]